MSDQAALDAERVIVLAELLRHAPRVMRLARGTNADEIGDVASEAATSLVDIERSCSVLKELFPRLREVKPDSTIFEDLLDGIAEEFRHIHFHIANTRLFNYVVERE